MRLQCRFLRAAGAICVIALAVPLVIPAVAVWAYCSGGGNIVGDH